MRCVTKWARWMVGTVGATAAPPAILSSYMLSTGPGRNMDFDFLIIILSILVGVACLAMLPITPLLRVIWIFVYLPFATCAAIMYAIMFVCAVFGACL